MNHLDLFSGIGGFALAARWAGFNTVGFSEIDPYASAVLKKHWPDIKNYGDIRQINRQTLRERVDIITGGFPCQPFSTAGKRRGKDDHRDLWPEMFRVIKEFKPTWVLGENVAGFVNMELDRTVSDLEAEGYEIQPIIIPACACGGAHRRDRCWIIAYSNSNRLQGGECKLQEASKCEQNVLLLTPSDAHRRIYELPASVISRADDGLPNRAHRIKALGNAIVPQVAYEILKLMKD